MTPTPQDRYHHSNADAPVKHLDCGTCGGCCDPERPDCVPCTCGDTPASMPAWFTPLGEYVRAIADRMGLRDWHLILDENPPEGVDVWAWCNPTFGQRRAVLRFATDTPERSPDQLRRIVVHELMHCHLDRMDTVYRSAAEELGPQAARISTDSWRSTLEDACDDIATAFAEQLPTIEWPPVDADA